MDAITIYEDGRPAGTLRLRREGLYTVLEAALPPAPGLTRLWLCGGGERADLGVMEPRPEGRRFRRRYTRAALSALPSPMEYVVAAPRHCEAGAHTGCGNPRPPSPETSRVVTLDGARYLALPCQLRHPRPGLRIVTLDGRDYLLFRYCAKPPTGV